MDDRITLRFLAAPQDATADGRSAQAGRVLDALRAGADPLGMLDQWAHAGVYGRNVDDVLAILDTIEASRDVLAELADPVAEDLERDELLGQLQPGRWPGQVVAAVVALAQLAHDHVVGDGSGNGGLPPGIDGRRERGRVHP